MVGETDPALDWEKAEALLVSQQTVEQEVVGYNHGGVIVAFGSINGFVPNSHLPNVPDRIGKKKLRKYKIKMVGQKLALRVIELDSDKGNLILSGLIMDQVQQQAFLESLAPGTLIRGVVSKVNASGVEVDFESGKGMVAREELSWDPNNEPHLLVSPGQEIEVVTKVVDPDKDVLIISRKDLQPNPWELFSEHYKAGDLVRGTVTRLTPAGIGVRLLPGIDDLIPREQVDFWPADELEAFIPRGAGIMVRIAEFNPHKRQIRLRIPKKLINSR